MPTSDMPGHRQLHLRVEQALDTCQESQDIDFKESAAWDDLKWRVVKTALSMGNLRDGGIVVLGASERGTSWDLTGITDAHLATYDVDVVTDVINSYISPHVDLDIVLVKYRSGKNFLAIQVHEFDKIPLVCRKNGQAGLVEGGVYIRPPGMARSTRIMNAQQMHDLLELSAEKRARRILEVGRRVGLVPESARNQFDEELGGL